MIGILVAMSLERMEIVNKLADYRPEEYYNQTYYRGTIAGKDVVVAESGVGKVASAITSCRLIEHFGCDMVLNIGTAGGIREEENILDVVVADVVTYHDWDEESVNERPRSFETNNGYVFKADEQLIEKAIEAMNSVSHYQTFVGHIVSGDAFVSEKNLVSRIKASFPEAYACDMESATVGHVCTYYGTPFVIIRSLSDIVLKEGNEMDFQTYAKAASERAAEFTELFVEKL